MQYELDLKLTNPSSPGATNASSLKIYQDPLLTSLIFDKVLPTITIDTVGDLSLALWPLKGVYRPV